MSVQAVIPVEELTEKGNEGQTITGASTVLRSLSSSPSGQARPNRRASLEIMTMQPGDDEEGDDEEEKEAEYQQKMQGEEGKNPQLASRRVRLPLTIKTAPRNLKLRPLDGETHMRTVFQVKKDIENIKNEIAVDVYIRAPLLPKLEIELQQSVLAEQQEALRKLEEEPEPDTPLPGHYAGQKNDEGQSHGEGKHHYRNGDVYSGQWWNGRRHGHGIYKYNRFAENKKCRSYEGQWEDGLMHGHGILKYVDRGFFDGQFHRGLSHGKGICQYNDGNRYEGQWETDHRHGVGKFIWVEGDWYEGQWDQGVRQGEGVFVWYQGDKEGRYTGQFHQEMKHGEGIEKTPDNKLYEGQYDRGLKNGEGTLKWMDGQRFVGQFVRGTKHGRGQMRYKDRCVYEGEYANGRPNGVGRFEWPDGRYYEGEWQNGTKTSERAVMEWGDGSKYVGGWKSDKRHGWGKHSKLITFDDGSTQTHIIYQGCYRNDEETGFWCCLVPFARYGCWNWNMDIPRAICLGPSPAGSVQTATLLPAEQPPPGSRANTETAMAR